MSLLAALAVYASRTDPKDKSKRTINSLNHKETK